MEWKIQGIRDGSAGSRGKHLATLKKEDASTEMKARTCPKRIPEGTVGPIGLRLDVGDEMYFNNGTHHNLKVMFGPYIRF